MQTLSQVAIPGMKFYVLNFNVCQVAVFIGLECSQPLHNVDAIKACSGKNTQVLAFNSPL